MMRALVASSTLGACLFLLQPVASAQTTPFTAEDILKVASVSVLDVTEDGLRVAATVRRTIDNEFTDHRRFGDPTYLATSRVRLEIIDTSTGARETPFKDMVNVRAAEWSRDGKRLALTRSTITNDIVLFSGLK